MCLGNYSWFRWIILTILIIFLFIIPIVAKAFFFVPALIFGAEIGVSQLIADIVGLSVVAGLAVKTSEMQDEQLNDYKEKMKSNLKKFDNSLNNTLSKDPDLKNASLGTFINTISPSTITYDDFTTSDGSKKLELITSGDKNTDNTYSVNVNGQTEQINFEPSIKNPVVAITDLSVDTTPAPNYQQIPIEIIPHNPPNTKNYKIVITDKTSPQPIFNFSDNINVSYTLTADDLYNYYDWSSKYYFSSRDGTRSIAYNFIVFDEIKNLKTIYNSYRDSLYSGNDPIVHRIPYEYEYVETSYLYDIQYIGIDYDSETYPNLEIFKHISGLPLFTYEIFRFTTTKINYIGKRPCEYVTDQKESTDPDTSKVKIITQLSSICSAINPLNLPDSHLISDFEGTISNDYITTKDEKIIKVPIQVNTAYIPRGKNNIEVGPPSAQNLSILDYKTIPKDKLAHVIRAMIIDSLSDTDYDGISASEIAKNVTISTIEQAIDKVGYYPTYKDLFTPVTTSQGTLPLSTPSIFTKIINNNYYPENNGGDDSIVDLGVVDLPSIEEADDPLTFIDNLFPFIKNLNLAGSNTCPTTKFDVFGVSVSMDSQCELLESNRKVISTIAMVVWSFLSFAIILRS